jgi:hypothetical protein
LRGRVQVHDFSIRLACFFGWWATRLQLLMTDWYPLQCLAGAIHTRMWGLPPCLLDHLASYFWGNQHILPANPRRQRQSLLSYDSHREQVWLRTWASGQHKWYTQIVCMLIHPSVCVDLPIVTEGRVLAKQLGCKFIETSAKYGTNVDKVFRDLIREIRKYKNVRTPGSILFGLVVYFWEYLGTTGSFGLRWKQWRKGPTCTWLLRWLCSSLTFWLALPMHSLAPAFADYGPCLLLSYPDIICNFVSSSFWHISNCIFFLPQFKHFIGTSFHHICGSRSCLYTQGIYAIITNSQSQPTISCLD